MGKQIILDFIVVIRLKNIRRLGRDLTFSSKNIFHIRSYFSLYLVSRRSHLSVFSKKNSKIRHEVHRKVRLPFISTVKTLHLSVMLLLFIYVSNFDGNRNNHRGISKHDYLCSESVFVTDTDNKSKKKNPRIYHCLTGSLPDYLPTPSCARSVYCAETYETPATVDWLFISFFFHREYIL